LTVPGVPSSSGQRFQSPSGYAWHAGSANFSKLLCRHRRDLLDVVQLETGKARLDAAFEMGEAVMSTAQHARTAAGLLDRRRHRGMLRGLSAVQEIRHPKGVVSVIIPWNFPLALAVCDALPALIAGNAVILKPDNQTALSGAAAEPTAPRSGAALLGVPGGARSGRGHR